MWQAPKEQNEPNTLRCWVHLKDIPVIVRVQKDQIYALIPTELSWDVRVVN